MSSEDNSKYESIRYQFSGYQLPLLQWDETGPAWIKLPPHPYFRNQPTLWQAAWSFGAPPYSFTGEVYGPGERIYGPNGLTGGSSNHGEIDGGSKEYGPNSRTAGSNDDDSVEGSRAEETAPIKGTSGKNTLNKMLPF